MKHLSKLLLPLGILLIGVAVYSLLQPSAEQNLIVEFDLPTTAQLNEEVLAPMTFRNDNGFPVRVVGLTMC